MWFGSGNNSGNTSGQVPGTQNPAPVTGLPGQVPLAAGGEKRGGNEPATPGPGNASIGNQQTSSQQHQHVISTSGSTVEQRLQAEKISFHLKTSIFTRRVTIDLDKMALGLIKQLAIAFLNELYFQHQYPANTYIGDYIRKNFSNNDNLDSLYDRLVLRRYDPQSGNFVPFNSVSDIKPESHINIEVGERQPHVHHHHHHHHHHQHQHQHHQQGQQQHLLSSPPSGVNSGHSSGPSASSSNASSLASHSHSQLKMTHEFKPESFLFPTYCASCTVLIKGVFRQGFQCSYCKKNYCKECKVRAETSGDSCLATTTTSTSIAATSNVSQQDNTSDTSCNFSSTNCSNSSASGSATPADGTGQVSGGGHHQGTNAPAQANSSSNNNGATTATTTTSKLDVLHSNMSKRKSASNLLHFNIANPFKSHHSPQQQQQQQTGAQSPKEERLKTRGSSGALEPVLQQMSKINLKTTTKPLEPTISGGQSSTSGSKGKEASPSGSAGGNSLLAAQATHLSSSHQNLYANEKRSCPGEPDDGLGGADGAGLKAGSPLHQQSSSGLSKAQLSNSARSSAHDLHAASPTKRDLANHTFISMDWIQIKADQPPCGVCNKPLKLPHQSSQPSWALCKSCKLQVHANCQNLVLTDCMSRIVESSRAAAERRDLRRLKSRDSISNNSNNNSKSTNNDKDKTVKNSNSNVSRDNIRLHRLAAPSMKNIKRPDSTKSILEGWLQHTTLADEQTRKHYWRLDETGLTLYENATSKRYFRAIPLSTITRVMSAHSLPKRVREDILLANMLNRQQSNSKSNHESSGKPRSANTSPTITPELRAQMNAILAFEQVTGSMYLVQASSESEANKWRESLAAMTSAIQQKDKEQQQAAAKVDPEASAVETTGESAGARQLIALASDEQTQAATGVEQTERKAVTQVSEQPAGGQQQQQKQQEQQQQPTAQPQQQPVSAKQTPTPARHHHGHYPPPARHQQHRNTYTDPNRSRLYNRPRITIKIDPMCIPDHWIEGKYLIERDRVKGVGFEELGSGQFGKVYAAISEWKAEDASKGLWSGVPVAIKEISKARFDLRQQAKLKNEANILSRLDHPGVIILERVHDLPDKIYIVMEQLEDDMLEMIVSTEEKRLNERITKFLTYQILEALKYLHAQNIAHCDLKPENVLLVERRSQFPQIKLCDFGFAKIIEENSFRCSLVGTPAYLAPEVVKGERYNRSVDLWSVGVIVYVSLSGEFPFNEGENIHDQISRATFMWPDQPWAKISSQAKNFINSLLRVNCEKRLSASRAQMDDWIQDYQLWCDLSELEVRVGKRWVTDDADFQRWSRYAKKHNLQLPRSAIQLHEDLIAD